MSWVGEVEGPVQEAGLSGKVTFHFLRTDATGYRLTCTKPAMLG